MKRGLRALSAWAAGALLAGPLHAADLTALEMRWLQGAMPVLQHAQASRLPLDIVVQPQPTAGLAPLALAFLDGRCKLVLSMRDNPAAGAALAGVEPALHDAVLELMAAHELGHCLRYLDGNWHARPAGPALSFAPTLPEHLRADQAQMQATRLEEAFGDLAGLAWIRHARPDQYVRVHRWLVEQRSADLPGSHHDTLAWLRLVEDGSVLAGATPFERVADVWRQGVAQLDRP